MLVHLNLTLTLHSFLHFKILYFNCILFATHSGYVHITYVIRTDKLTQADLLEHQDNPLMVQLIGLLQATSYLKVPLIACNVLVIAVELIAG